MKKFIVYIYRTLIKELFLIEYPSYQICDDILSKYQIYQMYDNILSINFKTIDHPKLNCFESNDLSSYIVIYKDNNNDENQKLFLKLRKEENLQQTIDLKRIDSISSSKSKSSAAYTFDTIYLFGKNVYIDRNDKWSFDDCIKHIMSRGKILNIYYYNWNNRYDWNNFDSSHHFAVANYLLTNEKKEYHITCNITIKSIDENIAKKILDTFQIFVIHGDNKYELRDIIGEKNMSMYNIVYTSNSLILIDKSKKRLNQVIELLKKFDDNYVFDFNKYLIDKLEKQNKYQKNNNLKY